MTKGGQLNAAGNFIEYKANAFRQSQENSSSDILNCFRAIEWHEDTDRIERDQHQLAHISTVPSHEIKWN